MTGACWVLEEKKITFVWGVWGRFQRMASFKVCGNFGFLRMKPPPPLIFSWGRFGAPERELATQIKPKLSDFLVAPPSQRWVFRVMWTSDFL